MMVKSQTSLISNPNGKKKESNEGLAGQGIIYEEDQEQVSDHSDRDKLDKEINNFLREANHDMVRQGHHQKTVTIPRHSSIG
jgi:Fe-S cluster biosynthesis and repair protein YggX